MAVCPDKQNSNDFKLHNT